MLTGLLFRFRREMIALLRQACTESAVRQAIVQTPCGSYKDRDRAPAAYFRRLGLAEAGD